MSTSMDSASRVISGDEMSDDELNHADTGSHVFPVDKFTIVDDALKDVTIRITV